MDDLVSGSKDAKEAGELAYRLTMLLRFALTTQDDYTEVVNKGAWKEESTVLATTHDLLGQMLTRLNRDS
jgi:hypothetical protein